MPENSGALDFYLPNSRVWIECKRFHADRVVKQLGRHDNVILIQGRQAANTFASLVTNEKNIDRSDFMRR